MCLSNMRQESTSDARPSDAGPLRVGPSGTGTPDVGVGLFAPAGPSDAGPSAPADPPGAGPYALADPPGQPARTLRRQRIPQGTSIR